MTNITKRQCILIIDDDKAFAMIIAAQANTMGIDVTFVPSITKARDIKSLANIDLLLVDYDLDDGTGFEAAQHFLNLAKEKPVVMISSTDRPRQDKLGALPNIIGFVSKWHRPNEFMSHLLTVTQSRPGISLMGT